MKTNCCNVDFIEDSDFCSKCREHSDNQHKCDDCKHVKWRAKNSVCPKCGDLSSNNQQCAKDMHDEPTDFSWNPNQQCTKFTAEMVEIIDRRVKFEMGLQKIKFDEFVKELEADIWNQLKIRIKFNKPISMIDNMAQSEAANTGQTGFQPNDVTANSGEA